MMSGTAVPPLAMFNELTTNTGASLTAVKPIWAGFRLEDSMPSDTRNLYDGALPLPSCTKRTTPALICCWLNWVIDAARSEVSAKKPWVMLEAVNLSVLAVGLSGSAATICGTAVPPSLRVSWLLTTVGASLTGVTAKLALRGIRPPRPSLTSKAKLTGPL